MSQVLEATLDPGRDSLLLRSPEVGLFTRPLPVGALVAPGMPVGVLHSLGRRFDLVAPAGATGRVLNAPPERVLAPVGYGTRLYELAALGSADALAAAAPSASGAVPGALAFRAPYSGRFWMRPAPGDPAFAEAGAELGAGQTLGLIEVMKTFTHLVYRPGGELPERARLLRFLVKDGAEVEQGAALLELEAL